MPCEVNLFPVGESVRRAASLYPLYVWLRRMSPKHEAVPLSEAVKMLKECDFPPETYYRLWESPFKEGQLCDLIKEIGEKEFRKILKENEGDPSQIRLKQWWNEHIDYELEKYQNRLVKIREEIEGVRSALKEALEIEACGTVEKLIGQRDQVKKEIEKTLKGKI